MVIASTNWIQNVSDSNKEKIMSATGTLICHDNSYPFKKRTLCLSQPIKIGRSVARARASNDNAIFDCKVLSRNHAILWYDSGKFYIKDTKSSNGTFVNNKRLSPSGEESVATEVCSDNIVQFGVDVVESNKKVTHGCIVATLKLYLPDGNEAKACLSNSIGYVNVSFEDLYKLNQFIQEAGRRESVLRSKLEYMQQLLEHTRIAANQSWKALVLEDCLLSRLEILQNQVISYSKNFGEDKLRIELIKLLEDKVQYQNATKELLQKKLQEKHEIIGKVQSLKCRLNENKEEIQSLHNIIKQNQYELQDFAIKHIKIQQTLQDTNDKLNKTKLKLKEVIQQSDKNKEEYVKKLQNHKSIERNLQIGCMNSKSDIFQTYKQIAALRNYMQILQDIKYITDGSFYSKDNLSSFKTVNIIMNKYNNIHIYISDYAIEYKNQHKIQMNAINTNFKLSNIFFICNNFIKHECNRLLMLESNHYNYIVPITTSKILTTNNIVNSRILSLFKPELFISKLEKSFDFTGNNELSSQTINKNISVSEIQENSNEQEDSKSIKLVIKLLSNISNCCINSQIIKNDLEVQINCYSFKNLLQHSSIQIINIAKQINSIIETNINLLTDQSKSKIKQIYWHNDYIINFFKSIANNVNDDTCTLIEFSQENVVKNIEYSFTYFERNKNKSLNIVVQELLHLKNWLLLEPNKVIDDFKKYYEQKIIKNESRQIQEMSEQLVILKEKYNISLEEKANIKRKYIQLKSQCKDFINTTYMVPVYYVAPIVFALIWMLIEKLM